ncbi:MAG: FHA domain-containing protein [Phycisphaerales bacterium]|nr:FHA domain-containing protein [Phycisphaerales bacterium]
MANLTIMTGDQAGASFEIAGRPLSIGRDPSRDIQIMDMKVSRKHAVIRFSEPNHVVAPMKSMNALLVNGDEIEIETPLNEGDEIMLGDTVLRFSLQSSPNYTNALNHAKISSRKARDANTMM